MMYITYFNKSTYELLRKKKICWTRSASSKVLLSATMGIKLGAYKLRQRRHLSAVGFISGQIATGCPAGCCDATRRRRRRDYTETSRDTLPKSNPVYVMGVWTHVVYAQELNYSKLKLNVVISGRNLYHSETLHFPDERYTMSLRLYQTMCLWNLPHRFTIWHIPIRLTEIFKNSY